MREVAPWGLVFVPLTGEAGGEKGAPGVLGWWSPFPALTVAKGSLLSLLALQEIVLGGQRSRKEGPGPLLFCFPDRESVISTIYGIQVSSQAHSVPQCWGDLGTTARG